MEMVKEEKERRREGKRKRRVSDFFDEYKGRLIEIHTKFLPDKMHYVYRGVLIKKGKRFLYLVGVEVFEIQGDTRGKIGEFEKIAINKDIVSWVIFP